MARVSLRAGGAGAQANRYDLADALMMRCMLSRMGGVRGVLMLVFLAIALTSAAWAFVDVIPDIPLGLVGNLTLVALISGWLLARSRLPGGAAWLVILFTGLLGSFFYLTNLGGPLSALLRAAASSVRLDWPPSLNTAEVQLAVQELGSHLQAVTQQAASWAEGVRLDQPTAKPYVVAALWGLVLWLAASWSAWGVFRHHSPVLGLLPLGIILAGTLNYTRGNALLLVPFAGALLALMITTLYDRQEFHWVQERIDFAEDIHLDLAVTGGLLVVGLVFGAVFAPNLSLKQINRLSQQLFRPYQQRAENLGQSLGLEVQVSRSSAIDRLQTPGLPRQHLLGSGPELSENVVMTIETGELPRMPSPELLPSPAPRYYWRSTTYDHYTGRGWASSETYLSPYRGNQPAVDPALLEGSFIRRVTQQIHMAEDAEDLVYVTGELIVIDADYQIAWRLPQGQHADLFGATTRLRDYQAESYLARPAVEQLRLASDPIPEWIAQRYLALPDGIPERVGELAQELTRAQANRYDKAAAIEAYLRTYPYSLEVPLAPANQDVTDYFLFTLQEGYCDYFATSMVVLARLAGLPARLVTGYAPGTYDTINARYVVTQADAHSWVEVYFPGIGWVEFEPTSGLPAMDRRGQAEPVSIPPVKPAFHAPAWWVWLRTARWAWFIGGVSLAAALALIVWTGSEKARLLRLPPANTIGQVYQRLFHSVADIVQPAQAGDTPSEITRRLRDQFRELARGARPFPFLARAGAEAEQITDLYNLAAYSPHPATLSGQVRAVNAWLRLRWHLAFARSLKGLYRVTRFMMRKSS